MKKKQKITIDDVLYWMLENKNNTEAMDAINFSSFPHTSKYKRLHGSEPNKPIEEQTLDDVT